MYVYGGVDMRDGCCSAKEIWIYNLFDILPSWKVKSMQNN